MTVASLVHSNIVRHHYSVRRSEAYQNKKARRSVAWILIFAIFLTGFWYVLTTNNIAAKGYKIRNLQKQARELESINKNLQVEVSNLKSNNILEAKSNNLDMVKAQNIEYVSLSKTSAMLVK